MTSLREEFETRGPWITRFWVDGVAYGGSEYDPKDDARLAMFKRRIGPLQGKRVLELGPLEGGHTLQLAREGATVVAIEGHQSNYERCLFIKGLFGLANAEFIHGDLRTFDFDSLGRFDAVFNVGVLYHLDEPWWNQYTRYLTGIVQGDLGPSYKYLDRNVTAAREVGMAAVHFRVDKGDKLADQLADLGVRPNPAE